MSCHDDLDVWIELQHQVDEALLPFKVKTDFRFVHEEHVWLVVLHQDGEEDGKDLLLACRELIRQELLAHLVEANLVGSADDDLSSVLEKTIHYILEEFLGLA